MKFSLSIKSLICAICVICGLSSASALSPATAAVTNLRSESSSDYVSQEEFFRGMPLLLTNCIAFAGASTSSPRQDLTGLTLTLAVGTVSSNFTNAAYASDPTNGAWWAQITVPTNFEAPALQFKISDTTNTFIYPWKLLKTKQPL
jgi:hypothetical protein